MKKLFSFLLILNALCAIVFTSCQREVDFDQNNLTGDFRATIDGTPWVANKAAVASRSFGLITIGGLGLDKKTISITLTDSGVHRYTLNQTSINVGAFQDSALASVIAFSSNGSDDTSLAGGYVQITSIDTVNKRLSGHFSFKVYRAIDGLKRNITEGIFTNISYAPVAPPVNTTDTFRVKIAGTQWVPEVIVGIKTAFPPPLPNTLNVTGTNLTTLKSVGITMPDNVTPGTYTLDFFSGTHFGAYNPDSDPNHSQASTSGTLTLLEHNTSTKRIRGNFNFRAETILPGLATDLTEGYFSVRYQ